MAATKHEPEFRHPDPAECCWSKAGAKTRSPSIVATKTIVGPNFLIGGLATSQPHNQKMGLTHNQIIFVPVD